MKNGYPIKNFKQGDVITRVEKGFVTEHHYNEVTNSLEEVKIPKYTDFMSKRVVYQGIYNNHIWVDSKGKTRKLNLEDWSEGWDYYEAPEGYTEETEKSKENIFGGILHTGNDIPSFPDFLLSKMKDSLDSDKKALLKKAEKNKNKSLFVTAIGYCFVMIAFVLVLIAEATGKGQISALAVLVVTVWATLTSQKIVFEIVKRFKKLTKIGNKPAR